MEYKNNKTPYVLQWADNVMILGQRIGEWCGHGPVLEQDIALTNIALDLIGEARNLYQYAAELEGGDATEDSFPMQRDIMQWSNVLLVEQPNGDFGHTIIRQFMWDTFHYHFLNQMLSSSDVRLTEIAAKSIKEATYHLKYSSEWVLRLGDGTEESHKRIQNALEERIPYYDELFMASDADQQAMDEGYGVDLSTIQKDAKKLFTEICNEATLDIPQGVYPQKGGKNHIHTEHLGYILAELQYLQKSYPGATW